MERPPQDPEARREWLNQWVEERVEDGRIEKERVDWRTRLPQRPRRFRYRLALARAGITRRLQRLEDLVFDRGLDTAGETWLPEHEHPDRVYYVPSPWHTLPRALRHLRVSESDVFVDFGCGKGRVLHQAAKHPFRRVVGVEISSVLAEHARAALELRRNQHRCKDVEVVIADVADYRVPDDMTVAYLYYPFTEETLDTCLRGIIESMDRRPRPVRLIYLSVAEVPEILGTGRFRLLKEFTTPLLDRRNHRTSIYESV